MTSKARESRVIRKPVLKHPIPQAHSPTGRAFPNFRDTSPVPVVIPTFEQKKEPSALSQFHSIASTLSRTPNHRSNTSKDPLEMSLQEYHRQHGRDQDVEAELSTDSMPAELEGIQPVNTNMAGLSAPSVPPHGQYVQQHVQQLGIPQTQLPKSYFVVDSTTGLAYLPTTQPKPRPISPPAAISTSYEFLGVPVVTSSNTMDRAKEAIVRRYGEEFRGMTNMGEGLIRRLVDLDLEREKRIFEGLVWRGAGHDEFVGFAEWLIRGGE
jgi:hypothetical protein